MLACIAGDASSRASRATAAPPREATGRPAVAVAYARGVAQDSGTTAGRAQSPGHPDGRDGDGVAFRERLTVPWWAWPLALAFAAFLAAEVFLGAPTALVWVPYAILLPATAWGLLALGRIVIRVADGELYVDDAHLPVSYVTEVNVLDPEAKRALLGPVASRYAFIVQRPWISGTLRIVIADPADPTPYWIVSSRRPTKLAAAIIAARDTTAAGPT
jgi:Protein of unknown function (DUF3093)